MNKFLVICVFICLVSFSVIAQSNVNSRVTPEMRTEANNFYQKQDWENAAKIYEKIVKLEENNVGAIYRLGLSLLNLNKNTEAKIYLEKVFNMSPNPVFALSLAKNYARLGDKEKVFEVLEKSITLGGINPDNLTTDKDFEVLKNEQKFVDLVKKSDLAVNPCKASPEFRQFDFWIGEWDAKNTQGVTVGSSSIQLILGNCVIFENWSTPVSSGKSFNIYDKATKKWHQNWVDDKGNYTHYVGEIIDGKMVYIADSIQNGKKSLLKMTFSKLPNGNIHQHGESSTDEGKTWTTTFDFTYIRKK
ncbi:MAG: tetratricopeptide repeat protein [Pyrinomonadaceae bacterium]|nr:tetratricopeptide repeat protein [Pyrinomonadaceae bacterium]